MTIYQVHSALGGCGASAVAWTLAEQTGAAVAFELSAHQGGLAWCASGEIDAAWPRIYAADIDQRTLLDVARQVESTRLCSGGAPPPMDQLAPVIREVGARDSVVLDGGVIMPEATSVSVMPNHLRAMRHLRNFDGWVLCSVAHDGVPPKLVSATLPHAKIVFFDQQASVRRALQLGYPMPRTSKMRRAVDAWLRALDGDD
jgi:hypothetical protein